MSNATDLSIHPEDSGYSTTPTPTPTFVSRVTEPKERSRGTGKRIPHRKSRKGCRTCKGRKVKCDELQPSCSRCERLHIRCEYSHLQKTTSPADEHILEGDDIEEKPSPATFTPAPLELDLLQLELLHTWGTFTYMTMPWSHSLRDFWRVTVPGLALEDSYLMRAFLAIPALHLANVRPGQRAKYVSAALEHICIASESARGLLQDVSENNAVTLCLFSALSVIHVLATPQRSAHGIIADEEASFDDLLGALKGMKGILGTLWDSLSDSPLAPLFEYGTERMVLQRPFLRSASTNGALDMLELRFNARITELKNLKTYNRVIQDIRDATDCIHLWEDADALIWVYRSLEGFIPLLESQEQEALVLLGYFTVVLKNCETHWWMQGWAFQIMSYVYQRLDHDHRIWVYEPATEIGWIFPPHT
ncbi:C6 zinc finger protein [Colletotrichum sojae]|uniref:C6 zinc finger protein n=1 Tax=Colletotrichum sojae TaxID=2175907 RepID=A0A8H6J224_9PEZI|nr:C6 zinc finger protein [Colletotrichum sojae]